MPLVFSVSFIILAIAGGIAFIIDAWKNNWAMTKAIGRIIKNLGWPWLRRIIGILLGFAITIGGLFIISTIGLIFQAKYPDNTAWTWLTVIPVAVAGVVLYILMYSATMLELFIRGGIKFIFGTLGGLTVPDKNWSKSWQRGVIGGLFWLYVLLALYPAYNPWTGSSMEVIWYVISIGAVYTLLAKYFGISKYITKIFASIMILPLLFYALGKQQPGKYPLAASYVKAIESKTRLGTAGRNKNTAIRGQQTDFENDAGERLRSIKIGTLKNGVKPLDKNANSVADKDEFGAKPYKVKIVKKISSVTDLPTQELKDYFAGILDFFYEIKFLDPNGYYSGKSQKAYVTTNAIKGIIDVPEKPEINDPNKKAENNNPPASKGRGNKDTIKRPRLPRVVKGVYGQTWYVSAFIPSAINQVVVPAGERGKLFPDAVEPGKKIDIWWKTSSNIIPGTWDWMLVSLPDKNGISLVISRPYPMDEEEGPVEITENCFVLLASRTSVRHENLESFINFYD